MSKKLQNRLWYIGLTVFGILVIGWGIVQKWLSPSANIFNAQAFIFVLAGGFIIFMAWLGRNFVDRDEPDWQ